MIKTLFKWDGNWKTVLRNIPKEDIKNYFGKPITSEHNLGVWIKGLPRNCQINDYIVKDNNKYLITKINN